MIFFGLTVFIANLEILQETQSSGTLKRISV